MKFKLKKKKLTELKNNSKFRNSQKHLALKSDGDRNKLVGTT